MTSGEERSVLIEPKGSADMARGGRVVGSEKEGRPSPIDVHDRATRSANNDAER